MSARTAHGTGKAALLRSERRPLDELPPLNAALAAEGAAIAQRRGKPFERGNKAAAGRKPAMASMGVQVDAADPRYRASLRRAAAWRKRRCSELARDHGGYLSVGASTIIASAALALAASRYLYELAGALGDPELFSKAATLGDKARQAELTAIDIADRESKARPKPDPVMALKARMSAIVLETDTQRRT